jgi:hypothetical protein
LLYSQAFIFHGFTYFPYSLLFKYSEHIYFCCYCPGFFTYRSVWTVLKVLCSSYFIFRDRS